uniref:Endonuclease/exonuclease/phosphatase domain-containing protein n=2 Tax=Amorphochlora amoebiformis TaxID=1561963 RepID=A0A7S0DJ01_9EUKA|mmetsp:Transcript_30091/g.48214  ORF Transcript_30091/g.48214 Transcript_30091/m.48214 type:complete len:369 (+) Transcript_30091:100-1206(+)
MTKLMDEKKGGSGILEEEEDVNEVYTERMSTNESEPTDQELAIEVKDVRTNVKGFSVLTWNVWFGDMHESSEAFERRCQLIVESLGTTSPDIIALQEVTPTCLSILLESEWLKTGYDVSRRSINTYGVLILTRKELKASFTTIQLPTKMGRDLHIAKCNIGGRWVVVGCVHLESLNNPAKRKQQLRICKTSLDRFSECKDSILVGDFNFCSYRNYNPEITPLENNMLGQVMLGFVDVWPALNKDSKGFTFDSECNTNVDRYERMRYDRVMARTLTLKPTTIKRYGTHVVRLKTKPEPKRGKIKRGPGCYIRQLSILRGSKRHLSDHFGLLATFAPLQHGERPMPAMLEGTSQEKQVSVCRVLGGCSIT